MDTMLNQSSATNININSDVPVKDSVKLLHEAFKEQLKLIESNSGCLYKNDTDRLNQVRISYYEAEYIVLENEFIEIIQNIKSDDSDITDNVTDNNQSLNYDYFDVPSVEMGNLLLIICSFLESIVADMDLTLDLYYCYPNYINIEQYCGNRLKKKQNTSDSDSDNILKQALDKVLSYLKINNFYDLYHTLIHPLPSSLKKQQNNQQNKLDNSHYNTQKKRMPSDNITRNHKNSKKVSTTTTTTRQAHRHFDYDCLAHLQHRLGISDKKLSLLKEYLPEAIQNDETLQFPLKNAHLYQNKTIRPQCRPQWCEAYQGTKHYRLDSLNLGTARTALQALGAFYLLCLYAKNLVETIICNDLSKKPASMAPKASETSAAPDNITDKFHKMTIHSNLFAPYIASPKIIDIPENIDSLDNSLFSNEQELRQAVFIIRDPLTTELNSIGGIDAFAVSEKTEYKNEFVEILKLLPDHLTMQRELFTPQIILNIYYRYEYIINYDSVKSIYPKIISSEVKNTQVQSHYRDYDRVLSRTKKTSDDIYKYQMLQEKLKASGLWQ